MANEFGLIRYPGSKAKLHRPILDAMPSEVSLGLWSAAEKWEYREPFFGSGAIGFRVMSNLAGDCKVWLNDKDYWLVCLWMAVKDSYKELIELVMQFKPNVADFFLFKADDGRVDIDPVLAGFQKLALHQMSVSGFGVKSGTCLGGRDQSNAEYPVGCRWNAVRLATHIKKRNSQLKRFGSRLRITCKDFSEVVFDAPSRCLIYLDPPYVEKGGMLYKHNMNEADHLRMRDCLSQSRSRWIVSYDDHPLVREMYNAFKINEIAVTYTNATNAGPLRPKNKEVVITN